MASSSSKSDHHDQQQSEEESAKKMQNHDHRQPSESMHTTYVAAYVVVGIVVVMSAAMGTIWAVVKPKRPVYVIEFGVIKYGVITNDSKDLVANLSFVMRSYNPNNKATIYYESMRTLQNYTVSVKTFSQPPFNVTRIHIEVPLTTSAKNGDDMVEYLYQRKIKVNISATAEMRFGYGNWKSRPRAIWIYCQPATLMVDDNFHSSGCNVYL